MCNRDFKRREVKTLKRREKRKRFYFLIETNV